MTKPESFSARLRAIEGENSKTAEKQLYSRSEFRPQNCQMSRYFALGLFGWFYGAARLWLVMSLRAEGEAIYIDSSIITRDCFVAALLAVTSGFSQMQIKPDFPPHPYSHLLLVSFSVFGLSLFLPPAFEPGDDLLLVPLVARGVVLPALE